MLRGYGKEMSVPLLNQISEIFSKNPMVLEGEIQKLVDYVGEKSFIEMEDDPKISENDFAGIGTREITPDGIMAIRKVYEKTFETL